MGMLQEALRIADEADRQQADMRQALLTKASEVQVVEPPTPPAAVPPQESKLLEASGNTDLEDAESPGMSAKFVECQAAGGADCMSLDSGSTQVKPKPQSFAQKQAEKVQYDAAALAEVAREQEAASKAAAEFEQIAQADYERREKNQRELTRELQQIEAHPKVAPPRKASLQGSPQTAALPNPEPVAVQPGQL